jgi:hypothetical protein
MKKIGIIFAISLIITVSANAQDYKMGLGVRLSSNAPIINHSISFKYFFAKKTAVETLLSLTDPIALGVLIEQHQPLKTVGLTYFYGGGAFLGFTSPAPFGLQGVLGLDYKFQTIPFNLSLDWKPEINLGPEFSFEPAALGISARFTFN